MSKYNESRKHSAELLKQALALMARHEAAFNPVTVAVWYEVVAGINPPLTAAVDRRQAGAQPFDDAAIWDLHQRYLAPPDQTTIARVSGEMQRLMTTVVHSATQAGDRAGSFGAQLEGLSAALSQPSGGALDPQISAVLAGTVAMRSSVEALQQSVASSREEIDRLRADLERARDEALMDELTGVLNRKGFEQRLQTLLTVAPTAGRNHCLVLLDIDHFKRVNDAHGHVMGDRVIQGVGEVLRSTVTDPGHASARYGGEEFAVLLPESTIERAVQVADAVRKSVKGIRIRDRKSQEVLLTVTLSAGVAELRAGDDALALVARADVALYESKRAGRDRVTRV